MSNSTAVAATIGVSALGVLAYYGYQNMNGTKGDVDETTLYNELDGDSNDDKSNFQDEAKKEVAKVMNNAANAWGSFWKAEYASQDESTNVKVSLNESKIE
jgi:uncharacterized membrane protein YebE (DUF533 family)